jgi:hypothetical protein
MPPTHPAIGHSTFALGELLAEAGRAGEAVPLLREAVAVRREALPPDHPDLAVATSVLGDALRQTGQTAEAEPLLTESHATLARAAAGDASLAELVAEAAERLAALYDAQGRPADAARLRATP